MQNLWYLGKLFASLLAGVCLARTIEKERFHFAIARILDVMLAVLLFFMGVNTALIPDLGSKVSRMGLDAAISVVCCIAGCLASSLVTAKFLRGRFSPTLQKHQRISWKNLLFCACMIGFVALGMVLASITSLFLWFEESMISRLLYILLFFVGMQLGQQKIDIAATIRSPLLVVLPLSTIVGTYAGSFAIPLFTQYTLRESLTLVSGFGWYSLSGVLITSLGDPYLGSVSFLSNLFRESASFFLIPLLAASSDYSYAAISIAGATSMDVTLPVLTKSMGETVIPLAMIHGVVLTLLAPLFITLWYG